MIGTMPHLHPLKVFYKKYYKFYDAYAMAGTHDVFRLSVFMEVMPLETILAELSECFFQIVRFLSGFPDKVSSNKKNDQTLTGGSYEDFRNQ